MWNTNKHNPFFTAHEETSKWEISFHSVSQFLNNSPVLPLFNSLVFSNDRWNLTAPFVDNSQVLLNNEPLFKAENYFLANNKLQSTLHAIFTLVIYPKIFVASTECPVSAILNDKNTYCNTFKL